MFLEFYKLREQPFGVTPDPRFLYFGATHREALASLLYAIETKRGFSALVAEPGMGKTSLLFRMLESVQGSARTAFLFQNNEENPRDLLRSLLHDLGISATTQDPVAMQEALNEALLKELHNERQVVVVIDEAQNLDEKVLESIRLLSNFETSTQKMMHIVLAGQPGLAAKLSDAGMIQLRQRVSTIIRLEALRPQETVEYVEHRLQAAGHEGPSIFSGEALDLIARISQGIPRNINSLCFQALSLGFATQSKQIGANILREVASDIDFRPERIKRASAAPLPAEPLPWAPPRPEPLPLPDRNGSDYWDHPAYRPSRPSRIMRFVGIAAVAAVPISILAFSDSRLGMTDTVLGRASTKVVNAVLSSGDTNADFVPPWPAKLEPPPPPAFAEVSTSAAGLSSPSPTPPSSPETSSAENQETPAPPSADQPKEPKDETEAAQDMSSHAQTTIVTQKRMTASEVARRYLGTADRTAISQLHELNPDIRTAYQEIPRGARIFLPLPTTASAAEKNRAWDGAPGDDTRSRPESYSGPKRLQVLRSETLFQFAQEVYGHSNWIIIDAICAANPQIHGPYSILSRGEWVQLPRELVTESANYNSRPMSGRSH